MSADHVAVFVPGKLQNPKNWHAWGVWKHRRYMKDWRERTAQHFLVAALGLPGRRWPWPPELPKRVELHAYTMREWDDDGLFIGLVPCRDALKDAKLVQDDAPRCGHEWVYRQSRATSVPGVRITVAPRGNAA